MSIVTESRRVPCYELDSDGSSLVLSQTTAISYFLDFYLN